MVVSIPVEITAAHNVTSAAAATAMVEVVLTNGRRLRGSDRLSSTGLDGPFRGRMGDRARILHRDGQGFCLCCKVLGRGYFPWPKATEGKIALRPSPMAMLWEGIDWRQPHWTSAPTRM